MMAAIRWAHAWSGLFLAVVVALMALSGGVSLFGKEIIRLTVPGAQAETPDPSTYADALARFEREQGPVAYVNFAEPGLGVHTFLMKDQQIAFVNAAGEPVETWRSYQRFEDVAYTFHHSFLLGGKGSTLNGLVGLAMVAFVVTGIILWAPAWRAFSLALTPKSMRPPDLIAYHRNWGMVLAIPILAQALTGAFFHFGAPLAKAARANISVPEVASTGPRSPDDWARVIAAAETAMPGVRLRSALPPGPAGGAYEVRGVRPGAWDVEGHNFVLVEGASGAVAAAVHDDELTFWARFFGGFLTLHSGRFGGMAAKIFLAFVAIALAAMSLYGGWSFFVRRILPREARRPKARPA